MLVDQHHGLGQPIPFFGRPARTALTLAKLARQFRCPVHGAFVERLGGARFRMTLLPALDLVWTEDAEADLPGRHDPGEQDHRGLGQGPSRPVVVAAPALALERYSSRSSFRESGNAGQAT